MITIVVVGWKIPDSRINDFYQWNWPLINRCNNVLVTDRYVNGFSIIYPYDMDIFNLSKMKNYGIRTINAGTIISCDIDIKLSREFMDAAADIGDKEALIPVYHSVKDWESTGMSTQWRGPRGVIATNYKNFAEIRGYDERFHAYGSEDGDISNRLEYIGIKVIREQIIWHVSHSNTDNLDMNTRTDRWNQYDNPDNREFNRKLVLESANNQSSRWQCQPQSDSWGLP